MKKIFMFRHLLWVILGLLCAPALTSCSKWDDFKEYIKDGEIMYTGKMDSVKVYAGKNRVQLSGFLKADPKIMKTRIYWNDFKDSVEYAIDKMPGVEPFNKTFGVDEGVKNFVVINYDAAGNASVKVNAIGTSYGNSYRRRLANRLIGNLTFNPNNTAINWEPMDMSTGAQYTEVEYEVNGETKRVLTPANANTSVLDGLKNTTTIRYRTIFKPEPTSIDTFAVAYKNHLIKIVPQLKNRKAPFMATVSGSRWGVLADWQTNAAAKIHDGGKHGGWDKNNGNLFNVESGWGAPAVTNGKIWQTLTLAPDTYTFEISDLRDTNLTESDQAYMVVALGNSLPDVAQVGTAIGSVKVVNGKPVSAYKITFTLTQQSEVSMGYLTTQPDGTPGRFANIREFNFYAK
jgi:hypothetical protein